MQRRSRASASGRARSTRGSASSARVAIRFSRCIGARACSSRPRSLRVFDPLCRGELERRADDVLLRHLAEAGPSELEDVQVELGLAPKELKRLRAPLERCGALVSRSVVYEEPHRHTSLLSRWDQLFPEPAAGGGLDELVVRAVGAAVLAPEAEVPRWFAWWEDGLVERLVEEGRLVEPGAGVAGGVLIRAAAPRGCGGGRRAPSRGQPAPARDGRSASGSGRAAGSSGSRWAQWVAEEGGEIVGSAWAAFEWQSPDSGQRRFWVAVPASAAGPWDRRRALRGGRGLPARPRGVAGAHERRGRPGRRAVPGQARLRAARCRPCLGARPGRPCCRSRACRRASGWSR